MGNMDARRDWGHAKDYVRMQWMMLQQDKPEDYVIATGVQRSVRDFIRKAAHRLGLSIEFEGNGVDEVARVTSISGDNAPGVKRGDVIVRVDPRYFRPTEVETLLGDPSKAKQDLGWIPEITLDEMISEMVESDLSEAKQRALLKAHGVKVAVSRE